MPQDDSSDDEEYATAYERRAMAKAKAQEKADSEDGSSEDSSSDDSSLSELEDANPKRGRGKRGRGRPVQAKTKRGGIRAGNPAVKKARASTSNPNVTAFSDDELDLPIIPEVVRLAAKCASPEAEAQPDLVASGPENSTTAENGSNVEENLIDLAGEERLQELKAKCPEFQMLKDIENTPNEIDGMDEVEAIEVDGDDEGDGDNDDEDDDDNVFEGGEVKKDGGVKEDKSKKKKKNTKRKVPQALTEDERRDGERKIIIRCTFMDEELPPQMKATLKKIPLRDALGELLGKSGGNRHLADYEVFHEESSLDSDLQANPEASTLSLGLLPTLSRELKLVLKRKRGSMPLGSRLTLKLMVNGMKTVTATTGADEPHSSLISSFCKHFGLPEEAGPEAPSFLLDDIPLIPAHTCQEDDLDDNDDAVEVRVPDVSKITGDLSFQVYGPPKILRTSRIRKKHRNRSKIVGDMKFCIRINGEDEGLTAYMPGARPMVHLKTTLCYKFHWKDHAEAVKLTKNGGEEVKVVETARVFTDGTIIDVAVPPDVLRAHPVRVGSDNNLYIEALYKDMNETEQEEMDIDEAPQIPIKKRIRLRITLRKSLFRVTTHDNKPLSLIINRLLKHKKEEGKEVLAANLQGVALDLTQSPKELGLPEDAQIHVVLRERPVKLRIRSGKDDDTELVIYRSAPLKLICKQMAQQAMVKPSQVCLRYFGAVLDGASTADSWNLQDGDIVDAAFIKDEQEDDIVKAQSDSEQEEHDLMQVGL
jgi:hypothetical protein